MCALTLAHMQRTAPRVTASVTLLMALFGGAACARADGTLPPSSVPPSSTPAMATATVAPTGNAVAGALSLHRAMEECLRLPEQCDAATLAVPGSPAHRTLTALIHQYRTFGLVAHRVPDLSYAVPESVRQLSTRRAEVLLCEVDGSWQMDGRGTASTADDIVWDDRLVSRRARHVLERVGQQWRRVDVEVLEVWNGVNRCSRIERV